MMKSLLVISFISSKPFLMPFFLQRSKKSCSSTRCISCCLCYTINMVNNFGKMSALKNHAFLREIKFVLTKRKMG